MKTQQRIHVKDMELDGSDLYFCGSMFDSSSMSNTAIMGYFDISNTQRKDHYKIQESSTPSIMPVTSMSTYMTNECH